MVNETSDRPKLTPKGARVRARIVEEAAALIHERGVAGTTLDDVKVAAEVSGSQMYHYFPDKNELVQAVIDYQAETIVNRQRQAFSGANGVEAWRNMVITAAKRTKAKGGCQLGSLVGQLAESDPEARALIAAGFDQWAAAIGDGLRSLRCRREAPVGHRPGRPRHYFARHAPRRTATRAGGTEYPPVRDCSKYPSCPCHRQMKPNRGRSQPLPRSAHGPWMKYVNSDDAFADWLPGLMKEAASLPVRCSGLDFRELRQPPLTARISPTSTGLVRMIDIS